MQRDQDDADRRGRCAPPRRGRRRVVVRVEGRFQGRPRFPQRALMHVIQSVIAIADRFARVVVRTSITDLLGVLRQLHVCNTMGMESGVSVVEILRYKAIPAIWYLSKMPRRKRFIITESISDEISGLTRVYEVYA